MISSVAKVSMAQRLDAHEEFAVEKILCLFAPLREKQCLSQRRKEPQRRKGVVLKLVDTIGWLDNNSGTPGRDARVNLPSIVPPEPRMLEKLGRIRLLYIVLGVLL